MEALAVNELSRRLLLKSFLGAPVLWSACGNRVGKRSIRDMDGGFALNREKLGHRFRDFGKLPAPTKFRDLDVLVVGGGVAGLSCMRQLERQGISDTLLLELDDRIGGSSQGGESPISAHPWAAHYVTVPMSENRELISLLQEVGAVESVSSSGQVQMAEEHLCRDPSERLFYRGRWYEGLYPLAGASPEEVAEKARFEAEIDAWARFRDDKGRRAFSLPMSMGSDAEVLRELDTMSMAQWMERKNFKSQRLKFWVEYACRDDYGSTAADTSAWSGLFYYASRKTGVGADSVLDDDGGYQAVVTWPEGNSHLVKHLQSGFNKRILSGHAVASVENNASGDGAEIIAIRGTGETTETVGYRAKYVVMATPQFINTRVVKGFEKKRLAAHQSFTQSPWMVANLHLKDRPTGPGFPLCWDNVLHQSPSLGYVVATHQNGPERGPTIITYYYPLIDSDPKIGRKRLLDLSYEEWAEVVFSDLERAHPELRNLVDRIDIARWGHGMVRSSPGRVWSGERELAATPHGRVHFAHSDLSGVALFEEAFDRGNIAARQVAKRLQTPPTPVEISTP